MEVPAGLSADELNQFASEAQRTHAGKAGRQVAAQGYQVIKTVIFIIMNYRPEFLPGRADTGNMGRRLYPGCLIHKRGRLKGFIPGTAAGTEGDREIIRTQLFQPGNSRVQALLCCGCPGRKKLEAEFKRVSR